MIPLQTLDVPLVEWEEGCGRLQGCYPTMTNAEYHNSEALSPSGTGDILDAPAIYRHRRDNRKPPTDAMVDGSAVHALVLEPHRNLVPVMPSDLYNPVAPVRPEIAKGNAKKGTPEKEAFEQWKPLNASWEAECKDIAKRRAEWRASLDPEAMTLPPGRMKHVLGAADSIKSCGQLSEELLVQGQAEASFFHTCTETGAYVRIRPDWWHEETGTIIDIKKSRSASYRYFRKAAGDLGYFRNAAMQWDILEQMGMKVNTFVFVVVEPEPPYLVQLFEYDDQDLDQGRRGWKQAATTWKTCTESGEWPGYPDGIAMLTIPPYLRDLDYDA